MYSFKEKKIHFNALLNPDAAKYDLELLTNKQPHLTQLATYSRNPVRYANDILYLLLDNVTREEIREFRRTRMEEETKVNDEIDKLHTAEASEAKNNDEIEELKQSLEEANERADEAEQRAEEAEEAQEAAEANVEEIELALEEEKKKEQSKPVPVKSKSTRNTPKSTGTTSSTHKSK